jgi:hypothetical protein
MFPARVASPDNPVQFQEFRVSPVPSNAVSERRQNQRYPINARCEYVLAGSRAQATTLDISSGGVRLRTASRLPTGNQIQVLIDWPALLDQRCPLRLVITGRILRSDQRGTVVGILRYEFRLRPRSAAPRVA